MNEGRYATVRELYLDPKNPQGVWYLCAVTGWRNNEGIWSLKGVQVESANVPWNGRREVLVIDRPSTELQAETWEWAKRFGFGDRWESMRERRVVHQTTGRCP